MRNKKILIFLIVIFAVLCVSGCSQATPYDEEEKQTYEIGGVTITVPASMNVDNTTNQEIIYVQMPDAQLAMVQITVNDAYDTEADFIQAYKSALETSSYENLSVGETSETKIGGKNISAFTYTYTIDNITVKNDCSVYITDGKTILFNAMTLPAYDEDLSQLVAYMLKNL